MYWFAGIIVLIYGVLFLLSKRQKTGKAPPGVLGWFYPMAIFLYQRACLWKLPLVGNRQVEKDLQYLHPGVEKEQIYKDYYVKKIALSLLICLAGTVLGAAMTYSAQNSAQLVDGAVKRGGYREEAKELKISTILPYGEETQFFVTVNPRQLSEDEAEILCQEFVERLPDLILGENVSLEQIVTDLQLEEEFTEYPFLVEWKSERSDILRSSGRVQTVEVPTRVALEANISYGQQQWQETIAVTVVPPLLSSEEIVEQDIAKLLVISENSSMTEEEWTLPQVYQGQELLWKEMLQDKGPVFAVGAVIVAVLLFVMADKDLHDELAVRRETMRRKYPDVIQKLLLYLGAGMTVRAAFQKMAVEYEQECKVQKGSRSVHSMAVYQEIGYMCRELQTGVSEAIAYEDFGRRIGVQEYLRLSTLLAQNLKKGNSTLVQRLREEADRANTERLQNSRKLGEEASTKLLVPMVLLLLVVMLMIMIPAFSSMGV